MEWGEAAPKVSVSVVGVGSRGRSDGQINVIVSKAPEFLRDNYK